MIDRARLDRSELPGAEERGLLRDSLRGFLAEHWPAASAVERSADPAAVAAVWSGLVGQGLASLGSEPTEGGLAELAVSMEELGRAACPAPLLGSGLVQLCLAGAEHPLLADLQAGPTRIACCFDDDRVLLGALDGPLVTTLRYVDAAAACTHVLLVTDTVLGVVDLSHAGVAVTRTRALGAEGWCEVRLDGVSVDVVLTTEPSGAADARRLARLLLAARAHGAARRAFELAVEHARERRQFGQPIGRFQAVQHKLADVHIALEGTRLAIEQAALAFDRGEREWRYFASAAAAFAGPALRRASMETHHAMGAIGYAEEHEAPRHWKRVHADALLAGGAAAARGDLASHLLDHPGATLPSYDLGPAGNAFRDTVRDWLDTHWTGERKTSYDAKPYHDREFDASFARDLGAEGWLSLAWPAEYGGSARTPLEQLAFLEVLERAEAPPRFGASVQSNAFQMHGTEAQRARWLPEIARGEAMHGMGYSEPEAGSDLASLRTKAVRDGDDWVITGQKIWTTTWWGGYMFLAARTDPEAQPAHAGISLFVVPMDAEGITVKTSTTMYDGTFANIFYDGVRVPADALVGPLHGGWKVLTDALAHERGSVGGGIVLKVAHAFDLLCRDLRESADGLGGRAADLLVRDRVGALAAEVEIGRRFMIHCAELAEGGTTPPAVGAMSKVFSGELMERFGEAAMDLLGPRAALSQYAPGALRHGRYEQGLRHSLMWVISIGTNEIQRSLIAQRGLGLPR